MPMHGRAQRPTLTYAQMYGSGYQEGMGIWGDFKRWVGKAAKSTNKFLRKTKILSTVGGIIGPLLTAQHPQAGAMVTAASKAAGQAGYGLKLAGGARYVAKVKNISPIQHMALRQGLGKWTQSGGVSLAMAKPMYPGIKNVSPAQVKALSAYRGRNLSGGGISLAVRKAGKAAMMPMYVMPRKAPARRRKKKAAVYGGAYVGSGIQNYGGANYGAGYSGMGIKLAGQGPYVGMGINPYKKKRYKRKKPMIVYRM